MSKKYADYMDEISLDDLYEGLLAHGLFSSKIPPVFDSVAFFDYCKNNNPTFSKKAYDYIRYDTMRNTNTPRELGIPVPMAYEALCTVLKTNWSKLQTHFHTYTDGQGHIISRNHIQLRKNKKELFEMNYDDWRNAGSPKDDLLIGKRFVVKADISTCFPSIYTHSIPWALVGKATAKQNRRNGWYNKIDKACQNVKYEETHGLLIGPHASNLISEVILTVVDYNLYTKGWRYIRNIDDYTCYVETKDKAESFITDLIDELAKFDLPLNHKKTKIEELPCSALEYWVRKLNEFDLLTAGGTVDYKQARAYFDLAVELMKSSGENASVLNYAIKVLSEKDLTESAKAYSWKMSMHLCLIYPYLISLMEEKVFAAFAAPDRAIEDFINKAYDDGLSKRNYEECAYALYLAIKHPTQVQNLNTTNVIQSDDCVYKTMAWLYYKKNNDTASVTALHGDAVSLAQNDFDRNWIFEYEVLKETELSDDWKQLKRNNISFLKSEYQY